MAKTRKPLDAEMVKRREMCVKLEMNLAELKLQVRTTNCLEEHGISTVGELLKHSPEELLSFPNFGQRTLDEVFLALLELGFVRRSLRKGECAYAPDEAKALLAQIKGESQS